MFDMEIDLAIFPGKLIDFIYHERVSIKKLINILAKIKSI